MEVKLAVMGHVAGEGNGPAVAEALIHLARWNSVLAGDDGNLPRGAGSPAVGNGSKMGAGHSDDVVHGMFWIWSFTTKRMRRVK